VCNEPATILAEVKASIRSLLRLRALPRTGFVGAIALVAGGAAFGQLLPIAFSPILTRLYTPADFGVFAVVASVLAVSTAAAALRYETALLLPDSEKEARSLLVAALLAVLATSAVSVVLITMIRPWLSHTNLSASSRYLYWVPIGLLAVGSYMCFESWGLRVRNYKEVSRSRVWQGVIASVSQLACALFLPGPSGLLIGHIAGQSAGATRLARRTRALSLQSLPSFASIRQAARKYSAFPVVGTTSTLLNITALHVPSIFLAYFYGPQVAGWYAIGLRCISLPANLIGRSVGQVYTAEAAKLAEPTSAVELLRLFRRTAVRLSLVGAVLILPLGLLAPHIVSFIFGRAWSPAGTYILLLSPALLAQFVISPVGQTLSVVKRLKLMALLDGLRLITIMTVFVICGRLHTSAALALGIFSACSVATYGAYFCSFAMVLSRRKSSLSQSLILGQSSCPSRD
jgi:O-antigen/teichoic acid export membrane protein